MDLGVEINTDNQDMYRRKPVIIPKRQKFVDLNYYVVVNASGQIMSAELQKPHIYKILAVIKKRTPKLEQKYLKIQKV